MLFRTSISASAVGKTKPRMWGPKSHVEAAIAYNSKRLGIDPINHQFTVPLWSQGGLPSVITNIALDTLVENNHVWKINSEGSCIFEQYEHILVSSTLPTLTEFTIVLVSRLGDTDGDQVIFYLPGSYDNNWYDEGIALLRDDEDFDSGDPDVFQFAMSDGSNSFRVHSDPNIADTLKPTVIVARWDGSTGNITVNGNTYSNVTKNSLSSLGSDNWNRISINDDPKQDAPHSGEVNYATVFSSYISDDAVQMFSERPYALLTRPWVTPPIIFDVGAGTTISASCSDGISLADTPSRTATLRASVQDGVAVSDSDSSLATFLAQVSDGVVTSDSVVSTVALIVQAADGITTSDQASAVATLVGQMADAVAFNDAATRQATFRPYLDDGVTLLDIASTGTAIQAIVADGVTLTDTPSRVLRIFAQTEDSVVVSDSGQVQATYTVQCQDSVDFLDTISAIMRFSAQVADGVTFSDSVLETSSLPNGRVQITITAKSAKMTFTVKQPNIKFQ